MSLTGGTFCAACQALFLFAAAMVPPAGLRKENGRMKINYTFANGENSEVEVDEEIGTFILDSRREEENLGRKERYHCYSMDAADYEGREYADTETPETVLEQETEAQRVAEVMAAMPDVQRRRLLLYAEGKTLREIARMEGVDHKAVKKSVEAAKKFFRKNF